MGLTLETPGKASSRGMNLLGATLSEGECMVSVILLEGSYMRASKEAFPEFFRAISWSFLQNSSVMSDREISNDILCV